MTPPTSAAPAQVAAGPWSGHPHFGYVRIGLGKTDLSKKLETPQLGDPADYEPVTYHALDAFLLEQKQIRGIAKPLSLRATAGSALVGENGMEPVYALARSIICQVAVFHSPADFKIMVVTDDPQRWDWMKWPPHCQHATLVTVVAVRGWCGVLPRR